MARVRKPDPEQQIAELKQERVRLAGERHTLEAEMTAAEAVVEASLTVTGRRLWMRPVAAARLCATSKLRRRGQGRPWRTGRRGAKRCGLPKGR